MKSAAVSQQATQNHHVITFAIRFLLSLDHKPVTICTCETPGTKSSGPRAWKQFGYTEWWRRGLNCCFKMHPKSVRVFFLRDKTAWLPTSALSTEETHSKTKVYRRRPSAQRPTQGKCSAIWKIQTSESRRWRDKWTDMTSQIITQHDFINFSNSNHLTTN